LAAPKAIWSKGGLNAWAKPNAHLICGMCYDNGQGDIRRMVAVSWGAGGAPAHAGKWYFALLFELGIGGAQNAKEVRR
jgi:hypothetical protein